MTSLDEENVRRAQAERRIAMQNASEGSSATWFLGIVVLIAIIGGILLLGSGSGDGTATTPGAEGAAPAAAEEVAPATTTVTE